MQIENRHVGSVFDFGRTRHLNAKRGLVARCRWLPISKSWGGRLARLGALGLWGFGAFGGYDDRAPHKPSRTWQCGISPPLAGQRGRRKRSVEWSVASSVASGLGPWTPPISCVSIGCKRVTGWRHPLFRFGHNAVKCGDHLPLPRVAHYPVPVDIALAV